MYAFTFPTELTAEELAYQETIKKCSEIKNLLALDEPTTPTAVSGQKRSSKSTDVENDWTPKKRSRLMSERKSIGEGNSYDGEMEDGEIGDDDMGEESVNISTGSSSVIVRGIDLSEEKLRKAFKENGELNCESITVDNKQKTATIYFWTSFDAEKAVSKMNGYILNGISIKVAIDRSCERVMVSTPITINTTQKKPKEEKDKAKAEKTGSPEKAIVSDSDKKAEQQ
ncbi:unnamed protein product [Caenorhabditis angaria]|uniref:RRM domain-containing protein n=1 Tax=Caenorhabditis angaria TaxID=860376 RepID=A0A9P1N962_9PELO|nr:unnamed protein product [Caenorhabditis angaria]